METVLLEEMEEFMDCMWKLLLSPNAILYWCEELDDEKSSNGMSDGGYSIDLYICELFLASSWLGDDLNQLG